MKQGFEIQLDEKGSAKKGKIKIDGALSTFINCGSQYAIWRQFPNAINYELRAFYAGHTSNSLTIKNMDLVLKRY